jgi:hypothetical protein
MACEGVTNNPTAGLLVALIKGQTPGRLGSTLLHVTRLAQVDVQRQPCDTDFFKPSRPIQSGALVK